MDIRKINRSNSEGAFLTDTQPYQEEIGGDPESMDNDTLADMATVELLTTLETPIQGIPTVTINNYCHARQIVKAALLAVFAAKPQE